MNPAGAVPLPTTGTVPSVHPSLSEADFRALPPERQADVVRAARPAIGLGTAIRIVLMLGRPRTCVPGVVAFLLGYGYVADPASWRVPVLATIAFVAGLVANLYNAYTDLDEDCRNLPGRVWLVYQLGARRLRDATAWLSAAVVLLAFPFGAPFVVFTVVGLVLVAQYSLPPLRLKAHPVPGLLAFSWAVVGPFLIGYFGATGEVRWPEPAPLAMLLFLLVWFVAKGMFKNVPDFYGDRAAGLRTSATVFGSWRAAALATTAVTTAGYLSLPVLVALGASPPRVLWALPWAVLAVLQCARLVRADDPATGNEILRRDMLVSSGFLATVLLLQLPHWASVATVVACGLVLHGSGKLGMDSRRRTDGAASNVPAGSPPDGTSLRPKTPQAMFDKAAPRYDTFNTVLSFGQDRRWRRRAARQVDPGRHREVLDVATGTASLALAMADRDQRIRVTGIDLNAAMLAVGRQRVARRGLDHRVSLLRGSAEELPFGDATFDVVTIAFAIDDMPDRVRCARELHRVLRPGGRVVLLELGLPEGRVPRSVYLGVLGLMNAAARARGMEGYRHLREEIRHYNGAEAIRALLTEVGFTGYRREPLTGGVAVLHVASRGGDASGSARA
ncbi:ubiquinone/menaquinone biosynthesis methyltransferases [Amycolatopsis arida]|uniref:Demethylmenaquinone methyltransferase n=1 Tax=Amycolatopsis arida TaxID=587909 RepID=A0A1I5LWF7_9PSEU|nr:ubiquinone/menaquinone biosynthesis methyltransferase [Amycolatopsis arida]TDX93876.1 ubiquinone/menaquinone biosynthesis methyltransferase [Amycolatopsis arida]SFP01580.1 ubiquinone/menaquinone biosynthesis methyltransferases [Amycolatopsis arida]